MTILKKLFVIFLALSFISLGCGRNSTNDDLPPVAEQQLWTMPDDDTDGIPNTYDFPENKKTKEIPCELEDGSMTYLDCSTTDDCNCNKIADNIEIKMVSKCGWGCVASNARTYVMIGTGLALAYVGYAFFSKSWPFGEDKNPKDNKDSEGNDIEHVEVTPPDIDRENSNTRIEKVGTSYFMANYIRSQKCKSSKRPQFGCEYFKRTNLSGFSSFPNTLPPTLSMSVTGNYTGDYDTSKFSASSASDTGGSVFYTKDSGNSRFIPGSWSGDKVTSYDLEFSIPTVIGEKEGYSKMKTETETTIGEYSADNDPPLDATFDPNELSDGTFSYRPTSFSTKATVPRE